MIKPEIKRERRLKRHRRVRSRVKGSVSRPRLSVFRSSKHIYAQIILDGEGRTLVAASTVEPEISQAVSSTGNKDAAKQVGQILAKRAVAAGIKQVVFDRGGYLYHGRVAALAEGAREGGLDF